MHSLSSLQSQCNSLILNCKLQSFNKMRILLQNQWMSRVLSMDFQQKCSIFQNLSAWAIFHSRLCIEAGPLRPPEKKKKIFSRTKCGANFAPYLFTPKTTIYISKSNDQKVFRFKMAAKKRKKTNLHFMKKSRDQNLKII